MVAGGLVVVAGSVAKTTALQYYTFIDYLSSDVHHGVVTLAQNIPDTIIIIESRRFGNIYHAPDDRHKAKVGRPIYRRESEQTLET